MKNLYFECQCSKEELTQKFKEKSYDQYFMSNGISIRTRGETFKVYSKKAMKHPFQRKFYGQIIELNGITTITGKFEYPRIGLIFWFAMLLIIIYGNVKMLCEVSDISVKIGAMVFFVCMYVAVAFLLFSGKWLFKKQEKEVFDFLGRV